MSWSADSTALPQWPALIDWVEQLRSHGRELGDFMRRQAEELEALRQLMAEREEELEARQRELAGEEAALTQQWHTLEQLRDAAELGAHRVQQEASRLEATQAQLDSERQALAERVAELSSDPAKLTKLRSEKLRQALAERDAAFGELREARAQVATLARSALELADARKETSRLRAKLHRLQQRLAHARGHSGSTTQHRLLALESERLRLAEQLAAAERQGAELVEQAHTERRTSLQERSAWSLELKRLRTAVETQTALLAVRARTSPSATATESADAEAPLVDLIADLQRMQQEMQRCASGIGSEPRKQPGQRSESSQRSQPDERSQFGQRSRPYSPAGAKPASAGRESRQCDSIPAAEAFETATPESETSETASASGEP